MEPTEPSAPKIYPVTNRWRADLHEALNDPEHVARRGWGGVTELSRRLGLKSHGAVSQILSGKINNSEHVPEIHRLLGWPPPSDPEESSGDEPALDSRLRAIRVMWRRLSEEDRAHLFETFRRLPSNR
jgi:hypothetical protein